MRFRSVHVCSTRLSRNQSFPLRERAAKLASPPFLLIASQMSHRRFPSVCASLAVAMLASIASADDPVSFNRDIRPILSENCFVCHGPDEEHREGGLRLDERDRAIAEADSGEPAIVPGDVEASLLIARVITDDEFERMPPQDSGKQLTKAQIELLKRWIAEGAPYDGHWAFAAPVRPNLPEETHWSDRAIDRFIHDRLKREGLRPSGKADRQTLIRRVTLDLTGVPPTPDEVQQFLDDTSEDAYEKLVDRLLMSPRYGEQMAHRWLDLARYADSNGFQSDGSRELWAWRQWLIEALNRNVPFDQFTIEQLAGDMLDNPSQDQLIATGFNRNHRLNGEGGRIVDEWFVETVIDRVETTGLTWLGLTLNCCRCHDHKYDPISQKEFYQLFAFFNSVEESGVLAPNGKNGQNTPPVLDLPTLEQTEKLTKLRDLLKVAKNDKKKTASDLPERLAAWEKKVLADSPSKSTPWQDLSKVVAKSTGGADFQVLDDGSLLVKGKNPAFDDYTVTAPLGMSTLSGVMLELLPDDRLANKGYGRAGNGNVVLTSLTAEIRGTDGDASKQVDFIAAQANYEQAGWTAESLRTGKPSNQKRQGWAIDGHIKDKRTPRRLMLKCKEPMELPSGASIQITMKHRSPYSGHNIGRFRLAVSGAEPDALHLDGKRFPGDIEQVLAKPSSERSDEETKQLASYYRENVDKPLREAGAAVEKLEKQISDIDKTIVTTMVMKEGKVRDAFVLTRGEYDKPADKVGRALPQVLPPMPEGQPMNRLGLARWIVDPSNPLTARVWVNRAWEHFFGVGIVKTSENFGSQAEFPSHPELLDWLAVEFMEPSTLPDVAGKPATAWDMKAMHKMMVMSATYQQASSVTPQLLEKDPANRLHARGSRFRLSGEMIRDSALAASGLLIDRIGGPSVRPYMPEGVWDETSVYGNLRNYKADTGDGLYRRTMYTIWKRTAAPPTMLLFDAPNREVCTVKRSRTNTPLQALSLLNEITFVEAARGLAAKMLTDGGNTPTDRLKFAFQTVLARNPTADELLLLEHGLKDDQKHFTANPDAAKTLLEIGKWQPSEKLDPTEWAAYTVTANVLLNLDEFVTRD